MKKLLVLVAVLIMMSPAIVMAQYPQCEPNHDCDFDVDGADLTKFIADYNRKSANQPCNASDPCNGNFDCDFDVDGADLTLFIADYNRKSANNPCPQCVAGSWCYP